MTAPLSPNPRRLRRAHTPPRDGAPQETVPRDATEAYAVLIEVARRRTGRIPLDTLLRHVLSLHAEAHWPVQRAAMEAVLRRIASARREALRVASRPSRGALAGIYRVRRRRGQPRPYQTLLRTVEPLAASCDCADFAKSSLGLCKHILTVLEDLAGSSCRFERAGRDAGVRSRAPLVVWDPVRPLSGRGDWLERIVIRAEAGAPGGANGALRQVNGGFVRAGDGRHRPRRASLDRPASRLELVRGLRSVLELERRGRQTVDPALSSLLAAEEQRLEEQLSLREVAPLSRALRGFARRLYPYQREGVKRFLATGRLLLADDMGLGKTVQAIAACHALFGAGRVSRGLVLVPASLKTQWAREWNQASDVPVAVVEGGPTDRRRIYRKAREGFLIANYEQLWRDLDLVRRWRPGLVVLDEAQRIKNWATKTAACVKHLSPPYRLVLTGTPMENRIDELASIMDWVDEHALEPKWRLAPWHSLTANGTREVVGARNLDTLRSRLAPSMLRRVRSEVLDQLPPRTDTLVPVSMTEAQREEHSALDQPIASLAARAQHRPLTQAEFLRLMSLLATQRIIANGLAQLNFSEVWPGISRVRDPDDSLLASLSSPKLQELRPIIETLVVDQGRKVVVFSQWRRMLRLAAWAVEPILRRVGARPLFFTGEERQRRRQQNLVDFHDDPEARVLFATDAGGVGLNLQRAANACVNLDLPWNPAVLEQRIGRIHRLGQNDPIDVYNLVSERSIEARIAGLVSDKTALFKGLFDGTSEEVRFDRDGRFLASIERLLGGVEVPGVDDPEAVEDAGEQAEAAGEAALDELIEAADERRDDALEDATGGPPRGEARASDVEAALPAPAEIGALFAALEITPQPDGGIKLAAPPEVVSTFTAVLRGLADVLENASGSDGPSGT